MVARRTEDANRLYLVTCPACGASNPVNAGGCWHCEQDLPGRGPATGPLAPHGRTPEDDPIPGAPPSFFPVLREEAGGQAANDDEPGWDASSPLAPSLAGQADLADEAARRGAMRRRGIAGAASVALAALVFLWVGRGGEKAAGERPMAQGVHAVPSAAGLNSSPGPAPGTAGPQPPADPAQGQTARTEQAAEVAVSLPTIAVPTQTAAQTAAQTTAPPQRLDSPPVRAPVRSRAKSATDDATAPPAPPPVKAPCTPNVAALGLCSTASR